MISCIRFTCLFILLSTIINKTNAQCGSLRGNFRNIFPWIPDGNTVVIDTFFDLHACHADTNTTSFMECIEQCNGVGECVGLAHIGQQCSICRIDSDTESHDSVPDELRKRYLLDFDYLPTMSGLLGRDCKDLFELGLTEDGVYWIKPDGGEAIEVYCELNPERNDGSDGAGWIVMQRRVDASVDFARNWESYSAGFGDLGGNVWLGLTQIYRLVSTAPTELLVYLEAFDNSTKYAHYGEFRITDESDNFRLTVANYSGTAGDSLTERANGQPFTTIDRDNDHFHQNCAVNYHGAWWHGSCFHANLNAPYYDYPFEGARSIAWHTYYGRFVGMKSVVMKIRRV